MRCARRCPPSPSLEDPRASAVRCGCWHPTQKTSTGLEAGVSVDGAGPISEETSGLRAPGHAPMIAPITYGVKPARICRSNRPLRYWLVNCRSAASGNVVAKALRHYGQRSITAFPAGAAPGAPAGMFGRPSHLGGATVVFVDPSGAGCIPGGLCPWGLSGGAPPEPVLIGPVQPWGCN